ncbi:class I SAM-dependent methyltransferase [Halobacteriovorax marinus]|uniref:class I SAM-dependent methyltransferase n=1 Tax=Halobacteriovorax marinus TaxID=97084 RepID=UPI00031BA002|nr:class I SAM-dependent methyltransferase [Halobacteriovorax marinus]
MSEIKNKLIKNYKHKRKWAKRNNIDCYRLYDKEIPDYPYLIDIYKDKVLIYDRRIDKIDAHMADNHHQVIQGLCEIFNITEDELIIKKRAIQTKNQKYEKLDSTKNRFEAREGSAISLINLTDYLDTGLFLDHRPMRLRMASLAKDKKLLNLFCYTSMVSVHAALEGAETVNVDLSNTYLEWSKDNFKANNLDLSKHDFIRESVFDFLTKDQNKYDVIFLDPPTFSNSKRTEKTLDIQKDHNELIEKSMQRLNDNGLLIFSNNKRDFKMNPSLFEKYKIKDITNQTIPEDFKDRKIHVCFEIRALD